MAGTMTSSVGALPWVSPEVFKGEQFTEAGDIYSFGIIMWEIFTGLDPQGDLAPLTFAQKVPLPATVPYLF
jgi:serine/threonine protein kinase